MDRRTALSCRSDKTELYVLLARVDQSVHLLTETVKNQWTVKLAKCLKHFSHELSIIKLHFTIFCISFGSTKKFRGFFSLDNLFLIFRINSPYT